jgi:hypothetical protein
MISLPAASGAEAADGDHAAEQGSRPTAEAAHQIDDEDDQQDKSETAAADGGAAEVEAATTEEKE